MCFYIKVGVYFFDIVLWVRCDIRKTSQCLICKKEFKHYGEKILCSRECAAIYMSETRIGENNPNWLDQSQSQKEKCLKCGKEFSYKRGGLRTGQKRVFCSLLCSHSIDLRSKPQSNRTDKYPRQFNDHLKNLIKTRDGNKCQLCGSDDKLHVHHIDYNKANINEYNLITLCQKCHNATHNGRTFWEIIFNGLLSGSKVVKKPWGAEIHIVNHNDYCLKYLIFFKGYQFSYHTHVLKKELWHCVYGRFECVLEHDGKKRYSIFKAGDKLEINPSVIHQLQARKNSILVEVSTRDYPEDSIRLIEGCN
jgi:mannose-6-phosphate isomerase-like protein (cupin superfamily)